MPPGGGRPDRAAESRQARSGVATCTLRFACHYNLTDASVFWPIVDSPPRSVLFLRASHPRRHSRPAQLSDTGKRHRRTLPQASITVAPRNQRALALRREPTLFLAWAAAPIILALLPACLIARRLRTSRRDSALPGDQAQAARASAGRRARTGRWHFGGDRCPRVRLGRCGEGL